MTKKIAPTIPQTRQEAEAAMERLARLTASRASLQADLDTELTEVRSRFEPQLTATALEISVEESALEAWSRANLDAFGEGKTLDLVHGSLSFRTGMPTLKLKGRYTWEDVLQNICLLNLVTYVRSRMEIDKEKLLSDRDKIDLEAIGCRVVQKETFTATPKQEEIVT